jgi:hypothetical protein
VRADTETPLETRLSLVVEMLETAARELREAIGTQRETLPEREPRQEGDSDD